MNNPRDNRGVALITALLVVSLASVAAASLITHQELDIRRTSNLIAGDQAWVYGQAAEDYAEIILRQDQAHSQTDNLIEPWARDLPPIDLPGGSMLGSISDAQARLNLNNLIDGDRVDPLTLRRLQRLLRLLKLDPKLATAVADWIDPDVQPIPPDGAEDDYYTGLEHPYRTANRPMASVSELRLIKGFDEKSYLKLVPYVTALPAHTSINVNTAPPLVLACVADNLDPSALTELTKRRVEAPFKQIGDFTQSPLLAAVGGVDGTDLSVASQFFTVSVQAHIGTARATFHTLLSREAKGKIKVVRRAQGLSDGNAINSLVSQSTHSESTQR